MKIPSPRGPYSEQLFELLRGPTDHAGWDDLVTATPASPDDAQVALWAAYELAYRGFDGVADELEWHPPLLAARRALERDLEARLRQRYRPPTELPDLGAGGTRAASEFAEAFFAYVDAYEGDSLSGAVQRSATREQVLALLRVRSVYHLKEADPTVWAVPRLGPQAKAGLMAVQYDEYGCGDPNALHSHLFARGMRACGLDPTYGAYVDEASASVLEQNNAMTLFGLHRRLRGAALGHFAAFEATSSIPSRRIAQGLDRVGLPAEMIAYYDEHVEADAVHDQVAVREVCGSLVADEPRLLDDVFFGAFTCLDLESRFAGERLASWVAAAA